MKLWLSLRNRRLDGFKFVRQEPIGPYVADFICRERRIIIEVDGGQHADCVTDRLRDAFLQNKGFRVLRFWNNDVLTNTDGVLTAMLSALQTGKD